MKIIEQENYNIVILDQTDEENRIKLHESDTVLGSINPDDLITTDVIYVVKI